MVRMRMKKLKGWNFNRVERLKNALSKKGKTVDVIDGPVPATEEVSEKPPTKKKKRKNKPSE